MFGIVSVLKSAAAFCFVPRELVLKPAYCVTPQGGQHRVCDRCHSCHQDEQRLVWAVTRSRSGSGLDGGAGSVTVSLVEKVATTPPVGRLAWCTSQNGESILALAAYESCNENVVTTILEVCSHAEALSLVDSRDPATLRGALHIACAEGHDGILKVLLQHFSSADYPQGTLTKLLLGKDKYGHSPPKLADRRGHHSASQLCTEWLENGRSVA